MPYTALITPYCMYLVLPFQNTGKDLPGRSRRCLPVARYHGVLAPACPDRAQIVPGPSPLTQPDDAQNGRRVHRVSWAKLLARVFQYDVMCPCCSGRMKILTALIKPGSVRAYLDGVGLPSRAPGTSIQSHSPDAVDEPRRGAMMARTGTRRASWTSSRTEGARVFRRGPRRPAFRPRSRSFPWSCFVGDRRPPARILPRVCPRV